MDLSSCSANRQWLCDLHRLIERFRKQRVVGSVSGTRLPIAILEGGKPIQRFAYPLLARRPGITSNTREVPRAAFKWIVALK